MEYQFIHNGNQLGYVVDTINNTSSNIDSVIRNLEVINNSVNNSWRDETSAQFVNNFLEYINELKSLPAFYEELTTRISKASKNYDDTDLQLARKLKGNGQLVSDKKRVR